MPKIKYTESQIESLLRGIYAGAITPFTLPKKLYKATANLLNSGVDVAFGDVDNELLSEMKNNIYMFSAAKTFQQVLDMQTFLYEGVEKTSYIDFRNKAREVYVTFNENYLLTEYNTAALLADEAITWKNIIKDKDIFPYLKYVSEPGACKICRPLDGITLKVEDPFWRQFGPLNHWECHCKKEQIDKYESVKQTDKSEVLKITNVVGERMQPMFKSNPYFDKKIFTKKHPYFSVPKKYKDLALQNFNLPIP